MIKNRLHKRQPSSASDVSASNFFIHTRAIRTGTLLLFSAMSLTSQPVYACSGPSHKYEPVVMNFGDLRQPIYLSGPKSISKNGKIVLYKNYLLINEPNKGIHIFDNENPSQPMALGFLAVPGNLDITVKNDVLYADSYVDLVMIDLSNVANARSVARLENAFSPRYYPKSYGVDPDEGVITEVKIVY